jgi:lysyl-tRNA synthetase class 2
MTQPFPDFPGRPGRGERGRLAALQPALALRSRLLQAVRSFFLARDFLEVETPVRVRAPAPELHIEAEPAGDAFLRTSPELHMKRLLAAGYPRLFQLGPCFRRGERGRLHRPEFTMLEWYRADADYLDLLADAKTLIPYVAREVLDRDAFRRQGRTIELAPVWDVFRVSDLFRAHAGWDPAEAYDDDRFALDLVEKVEPFLPREHPVVLMDYPAGQAALARLKPGNPKVAERWELYVDGVELANAFSELTDPEEQRRRFAETLAQRRERGLAAYPPDEDFLEALDLGLPACAGAALGFDRLALLLAGADSLDEVRPFEA